MMSSLTLQQPLIRWKEWIPLVTQQQRLRNLIQIIGCNIKPTNDKESSYYYTLHLTSMCAPFYTSEKIAKKNPKWEEVNFQSSNGSATGVIIRIWEHSGDTDSIVTMWGVYFSGLAYIGPQLYASDCWAFCDNTLLFYMHGGYFTSSDFIKQDEPLLARITECNLSSNDIRRSYTIESLSRLHSVQRSIKEYSEDAKILYDKILLGEFEEKSNTRENSAFLRRLMNQSKGQKPTQTEILRIKTKIESIKFNVQLLKEERNRKSCKLKRQMALRDTLYELNKQKESELKSQSDDLRTKISILKESQGKYMTKKEIYINVIAQFTFRQKQLISELDSIYPIRKLADGRYVICNIHLPNSEDFEGKDELMLSVALGYCGHLVQMMSYILHVPLRYPIVHFGSRTKIIDHITPKIPDQEREFPLFSKGKDRLQFNYAVYLLNKNIAQLRWYCGMGITDLRATLPNLESLMCMHFSQNLDRGIDDGRSGIGNIRKSATLVRPLSLPKDEEEALTSSCSLDRGLDKWSYVRRSNENMSEPPSYSNDENSVESVYLQDHAQKVYLHAWQPDLHNMEMSKSKDNIK